MKPQGHTCKKALPESDGLWGQMETSLKCNRLEVSKGGAGALSIFPTDS